MGNQIKTITARSATLTKYQNGPGINNKLKLTSGGVSKYFLKDHLGSTIGLADGSGAVAEQTSYDSFGNATSILSTRYQFTGREYDSFTGLQFSRARWYDPKIGRFISEDPIGFGGGINFYGYVGNNPGNFVDSFGLFPGGYGDPLNFWRNGADQLQDAIERARRALVGFDPDAIDRNTAVNFAAGNLSGMAGLLRTGTKLGQAIYCEGLPDYRRLELVSEDVVNAGSLFLIMAGPFARIGTTAQRPLPSTTTPRSFNPFLGKTPPEIDEMFKNKGFISSGPDPMSGNGGYINPRSGRSYHIDPKEYGRYREPNHIDVNRPRGYQGPFEKRKFPY